MGLRTVANAAYLMHEDNAGEGVGLTWNELGQVWYNAMYKGLWSKGILTHDQVTYDDVRRCVVNAAKELAANGELAESKISAIEQAFDMTGNNINGTYTVGTCLFSGKITDAGTGAPLSGVKVAVYTSSSAVPATVSASSLSAPDNTRSGGFVSGLMQKVRTFLSEYFSMKLGKGTYRVIFSKEGYSPYTAEVSIGDKNVELNVALSAGVIVSGDIPVTAEYFPDETFRNGWVYNYDTNHDGLLSEAERNEAAGISLNYSGGITSLKGIEYFTALEYLDTGSNNLPDINLKYNTALKYLRFGTISYGEPAIKELDLSNNTELDLSGHTALKSLTCYRKPNLVSIDLTGCTSLEYANLWHPFGSEYESGLSNIQLTGCTSLISLDCRGNQLVSLDLSGNNAMIYLYCSNNQIAALNLSNCSELKELYCNNNQLTELDISDCSVITRLECSGNAITALDIRKNKFLYHVICDENVKIIRRDSDLTTTSTSHHNGGTSEQSFIVAELPEFYADHTGTYTFSVSFDREIPSGTSLTLEGSSGSYSFTGDDGNTLDFPTSGKITHTNLSAYFVEGSTYSPVIFAEHENESNSGGCNVNIFGVIILLAGTMIAKMKRL